MTVTLPKFGEIVTVDDGPTFIMSFCGIGEHRAMYCEAHDFNAPNPSAMREHCKLDGEHRIVSFCPKHRTWESVPPKASE